VEAITAAVTRLARLRGALDTLRAEAVAIRRSTDATADVFAHRGHR
jgi:hypothetical protein